jgi:hypothetical protein
MWISWGNTSWIAERCGVTREAIYRHAHAFDLFDKRARNLPMALGKIVEKVDGTPVSGSAIISAIKELAKLYSRGEEKERAQSANPKELFERMSPEERGLFARDGSLPEWFSRAKGATPSDSQGGEKESQVTEKTRLQ